jgi:hypothetical protein
MMGHDRPLQLGDRWAANPLPQSIRAFLYRRVNNRTTIAAATIQIQRGIIEKRLRLCGENFGRDGGAKALPARDG